MQRSLGKTGLSVEAVSLGGEGVLRTQRRTREAVPVVVEALDQGVRYCDTAPAYEQSQDYYGEAFRQRAGSREKVVLASKTHHRDKRSSLALLDDSLRRLGVEHLDIWQMHDLRTKQDLREVFGPGGAIEAAEQAKRDGKVRFVGLTGHHDPAILLEAIATYDFDTVLLPINPADPARLPFVTTVIAAARAKGMGVVGMKVMSAGQIVEDGVATASECIRYATAHADTVIIGCSSPDEVRENLAIGRTTTPMSSADQRALEARLAKHAQRYAYFKKS